MMAITTKRVLMVLAFLVPVTPVAAEDSAWNVKSAKGITEAWVDNGPANRILVTCTADGGEPVSGISFSVDGYAPPPNSTVTMVFDGAKTVDVAVDELGVLDTDCAACSENFIAARDALKEGETVTVRFPDQTEASFSLHGSREAIGNCEPDFKPDS